MTSLIKIAVVVLGSGLIGVSTAQQLARAGADVILLTQRLAKDVGVPTTPLEPAESTSSATPSAPTPG